MASNGNLWWERGIPPPALGRICSEKEIEKLRENGKRGAQKRWAGHIKVEKKYKYKYKKKYRHLTYKEKYPNGATERKRFTNMRYEAKKRNAEGSHTYEEWLVLKAKYNNMCLCCKRFEPEIKLTEDHIIPLSMEGTDYIDNIQPLCISCNTRKHTKSVNYISLHKEGGYKFLYVN